jgi:hypothetical protein
MGNDGEGHVLQSREVAQARESLQEHRQREGG